MSLTINIFFIIISVLAVFVPSTWTMVDSAEVEELYPGERDALLQIRDSVSSVLNLHANWTGPPCNGDVSQWIGISCSSWHVVQLRLEGVQLTGSLPPDFLHNVTLLNKLDLSDNFIYGQLPNLAPLSYLENVSLSSNRFTGTIPSHYIELPKLKELELQENYLQGEIPPFDQATLIEFNVSYNILEGSIPETGVLQRFPGSSYAHNSFLCGRPLEPCAVPSPSPNNKKKIDIWIAAVIAVAAALLAFLTMAVILRCYSKGQVEQTSRQGSHGSVELTDATRWQPSLSTEDPERTAELELYGRSTPNFDLDDVLRASAEVLGKGSLGTTYKATMESGSVVAVKRVKHINGLSKKEFTQQMQLLARTSHENLVSILSFYYSKEEKLVIQEFVPNGSLFDLLHENRGFGRIPLVWAARLSIIKDTAKGLAFLHQSFPSHKVPHANIKSSNVLIHRDGQLYRCKLSDYGLLPLLPSRKSSRMLAIGRCPEFLEGKKLTPKADVYCFGIMLLEVITGKIPGEFETSTSATRHEDDTVDDLSKWVRMVVNNNRSTDILDIEISGSQERHDEMLKLTELAMLCTDVAPERRPAMSHILIRIEEIEQPSTEN